MGRQSGHGITRRGLFRTAGSLTAAGFVARMGPLEAFAAEGSSAVARVPRRRLGRTNLEVSVICGNETMREPAVLEAAMEAGINYWHKAGPAVFRALSKFGRENHYVEICLDPAGSVEKDIGNFKSRLKGGLEYADFYKIHTRYDEGAVEAFHKLKDEGLVKYLAASFHSYQGAIDALKTGELDAIQVSASPVSGGDLKRVLAAAKEADAGVTLMKTMMGGETGWKKNDALEAAIRPYRDMGMSIPQGIVAACLAFDGVTNVVIQTNSLDRLRATTEAAARTAGGKAALVRPNSPARTAYCAVCGSCSGACPRGVAVGDIMRYDMYSRGYGNAEEARRLYASLPQERKAASCVDCGACAKACPHGVASPERVAAAGRLLG